LSTHIKDKVEKIEKVIAKLTDESAKGIPIVVEGKKDAQTLREFGVTGAIVTVKTGGKSFLEAAAEIERLAPQQVILLLDFDRRGREGTKRLQQNLERVQIKVNRDIWLELRSLTGHEIQCIESLFFYLQNLREKT
jgi:2,5-diamino-6-(ribosylamino)-4(3H)-pyrimidinone 5'-phosphate reductase